MAVRRFIALTFVLALVCPAATAASMATSSPALRLQSLAPFKARGIHFVAAERVTVALAAHGIHTRRVTAGPTGSFVVTFPKANVERCDGFVVTAVGSLGSRAKLRAVPLGCASTNPG